MDESESHVAEANSISRLFSALLVGFFVIVGLAGLSMFSFNSSGRQLEKWSNMPGSPGRPVQLNSIGLLHQDPHLPVYVQIQDAAVRCDKADEESSLVPIVSENFPWVLILAYPAEEVCSRPPIFGVQGILDRASIATLEAGRRIASLSPQVIVTELEAGATPTDILKRAAGYCVAGLVFLGIALYRLLLLYRQIRDIFRSW